MSLVSVSKTRRAVTLQVKIPIPHTYKGGGVALFKEVNGKKCILLGCRVNRPFAGSWTIPGGGQEYKETLSQAAVREFKEETGCGLRGRYVTRIGHFKIKRFFFNWETVLLETTQIINFYRDPKSKLFGGEFTDLKWIPLENLSEYRLHPYVKEAVQAYLTEGFMKPYIPKKKKAQQKTQKSPSKKDLSSLPTPKINRDSYELKLYKVGRDGTKYYKPVYKNVYAQCGV